MPVLCDEVDESHSLLSLFRISIFDCSKCLTCASVGHVHEFASILRNRCSTYAHNPIGFTELSHSLLGTLKPQISPRARYMASKTSDDFHKKLLTGRPCFGKIIFSGSLCIWSPVAPCTLLVAHSVEKFSSSSSFVYTDVQF